MVWLQNGSCATTHLHYYYTELAATLVYYVNRDSSEVMMSSNRSLSNRRTAWKIQQINIFYSANATQPLVKAIPVRRKLTARNDIAQQTVSITIQQY